MYRFTNFTSNFYNVKHIGGCGKYLNNFTFFLGPYIFLYFPRTLKRFACMKASWQKNIHNWGKITMTISKMTDNDETPSWQDSTHDPGVGSA
jgi:hypothetical protein